MYAEDIPYWSQRYGLEVGFHLEMLRLAGQQNVKRRDGWVVFTLELFERVGLTDRQVRSRVVQRAIEAGWLEVRRSYSPGSQYAYRLRPAGAQVGVVDLAAVRNRRKKSA